MNGCIECITLTAAISTIMRFSFKCFIDCCYDNEEEDIKLLYKFRKDV